MKNIGLRLTLLLHIGMLFSQIGYGQSITALAPSSAVPGQTIDVVIRGINTGFRNGITRVQMTGVSGITVQRVSVQDANTAIATLTIDANATPGDCDVMITTGTEVVRFANAFQVFNPGGQLRVNIQALPINSVDLSSFDVNNPAKVPLVFFCNIYNDNLKRQVRAYVFFSTASRGLIGHVSTDLFTLDPMKYYKITNAGFNNFKVNGEAGNNFINAIKTQGGLPPDEYVYRVEIRAPNGTILQSDETVNVLNNPNANPELIAPGDPFDDEPMRVINPQPLFQWFGNSTKYDIALYECKPGQTEQEAARNLPVYKQENITSKNFLYPAFAEKLKEGTMYAWQVKGKYNSTKGSQYLPSQMLSFVYGNAVNNNPVTVSKIIISPQEIELKAGQTFRFNVQMYDADGKPVTNLKPQWKITPGKATITAEGLLTAGSEPADIALVVKAGDQSDFATVKIITSQPAIPLGEDWLIDKMLRKVFGIPGRK